ncbi:MAG: type II toxin-antitoxin system VapC family toxin [Thermodesulfovibrionia bacterium]|nr:type II toxin-antitoxin system VapC family toxin [Thermodesulfovibrionia bacterium]
MITAVDTNILFDILIPGESHSASSKRLLDKHLASGKLILCEVVFAELAARFPSEQELKLFLAETGMRLVPSNEKSLHLAGTRWAKYAQRSKRNQFSCSECGKTFTMHCPHCKAMVTRRQIVLSDFLIGAHALEQADCLLSRDLGIYKSNFTDLKVIGKI